MKVFLTDDHAVLLTGIRKILEDEGFTIVGQAASVRETLDALTQGKVDVLITDYSLPDGDGLALLEKCSTKYPEMRVIVLSMHDEPHLVKETLKAGAMGYILKKDTHDELIKAINAVGEGRTYFSDAINRMLVQGIDGHRSPILLTAREREILRLIADELTNREIAEKLIISERTVETHRKNIFRKTGTHNLVGLMKYAIANHLI